jgi:hypothetical protein
MTTVQWDNTTCPDVSNNDDEGDNIAPEVARMLDASEVP